MDQIMNNSLLCWSILPQVTKPADDRNEMQKDTFVQREKANTFLSD